MILPLLGRREEIRALDEALERVQRGERVVVVIEGGPGSGKSRLLDELVPRLQEAGLEVRRAAGAAARESHAGDLARKLDLGHEAETPRALVIDDLHRADPTSIGLLQRAVAATAGRGLLLVLTHRPLTGARALALQRLREEALRSGAFVNLALAPLTASDLADVLEDVAFRDRLIDLTGGLPEELESLVVEWSEAGHMQSMNGKLVAVGTPPEVLGRVPMARRVADLPRQDRKLVEAVALAGRPLSVGLAAELLQGSSDDVLEAGERLSAQGFLRQVPEGFVPVDDATADRISDGMGEVRRATLFAELGEAMKRSGAADRDPAAAGSYLLWASRYEQALPLLSQAGLAAVQAHELDDALPLLDSALACLERSGTRDEALEGKLRLARAQCYEATGWDDLAAEELDLATPTLSGVEKVQALGWAGRVADDRQRVQESERYTAMAELEAIRADQPAMLGSLLTLHARALSRLGFANEAEAALGKGNALLEAHGTEMQRYRGRDAAGWIAYDEGRVRDAEGAFAELVADAQRLGGMSLLANQEAWWARALFQSGHPDQAIDVRQRALRHAEESASGGPVFLSHMALSEGAEAYGQYELALAAAGDMLEIVLDQFPAWENAARYLRARALLALGRLEEAAADIARALELCPPGIDGWRWRLKCRVLQIRIEAAQGTAWPAAEAAELTDQLLQAQWYQPAVELMTARAAKEGDKELARDAAALAVQLGAPMAAAEGAQAGRLWEDPAGRAVVTMVKQVGRRISDEWRQSWQELPWVAPALSAPELTEEETEQASTRLIEQLNEALAQVGLGDPQRLLSPAQRRAAGLVRRRRRRRSPVAVMGVAAAIVALGTLGGLLGNQLLGGQAPQPTAGPPGLEDTQLPPLSQEAVGQWNFGGDFETYLARAGASTRTGVPKATGYFWRYNTNAQVRSSPSLHGQLLFVGSGNELHAVNIRTGSGGGAAGGWTFTAQGEIDGAPTVALTQTGESGSRAVVFFGSRDGNVYGLDVLSGRQAMPPFRTGGQVVSSPLYAEGLLYVGSTDGTLYAVDVVNGTQRWAFAIPEAQIIASPAYANGVIYIVSTDGKLHAIDALAGTEVCASNDSGFGSATPVVVGDTVLIGSSSGSDVWQLRANNCQLMASFQTGTAINVSPAVADGVMYVASANKILSIDLATNEVKWVFPKEAGARTGTINSSPVIASGVVYAGSDDGHLYAIDAQTGELLWDWETGGQVRGSPAVADGAVFFGSFDGFVHAVGGSAPASSPSPTES